MPKRGRSGVYQGKMVVVKKRRVGSGYRRKRRGLQRVIRRTLFKGLERHTNFNRIDDTVSSVGQWHYINRASAPGEAIISYDPATVATREGFRIQPLSAKIRLRFQMSDSTNMLRVCVLRCRTTWGGISDFLEPYPSSSTYDTYSTYRSGRMGSQYKVLCDKLYHFDQYHPVKMFKFNIPRRHLKQINYSGNNFDQWNKNGLVLAYWSDSGTSPHMTCSGYSVFRFVQV